MGYCHGKGDAANDGCCYVDGNVCPLRIRTDGLNVYDHENTNLGTISTWALNVFGAVDGPVAEPHLIGITWACMAALRATLTHPLNRSAMKAAWASDTDYQAVADHWENIGQPRDYCLIYGPAEQQCCFAEDQATNDAGTAVLCVAAVTIRSLGGS